VRMRQALRLFEERGTQLTQDDLQTIREPEVRASRLMALDDDTDGDDTTEGGTTP
jgi:hypothetical protein